MLDKELKKLASAATPGPWELQNDGLTIRATRDETAELRGYRVAYTMNYDHGTAEQQVADADYIAAANPQTILALLQRIEELRSALSRVSSHTDYESTAGQIASKALAADDKAQEEAAK